jgi:spore maturation protein CgeB
MKANRSYGANVKLLVVHPGASSSTHDVFVGLTHALESQGHEVVPYLLDKRIDSMQAWLTYQWKRAGKPEPKPTVADTLYLAGTPIFERALRTLPDWVIVISAMYVHPDILIMLKRLGVPVAYVFTESPYDLDQELKVAQYAHVVFTNERTCVDAFRDVQPHSYYLPHAYDPERHYPINLISGEVPAHDVVFVGTGFQERIDLLGAVDWTGIDLGLYGSWNLVGSRSRLRKYIKSREPIPNGTAQQLYCRARIGLNLYRTSKGWGRDTDKIDHAESLNPRAYELAACGVFQVSDSRSEVREIFGTSVETFGSRAEFKHLIRSYLKPVYDDARHAMARMSKASVQPHTFDNRAAFLTETLNRVARDRALRIVSRDGLNPPAAVSA